LTRWDPEHVLRDVRNELVSLAAARDDDGVVIDPAARRVDLAATQVRRADLRSAARPEGDLGC
jgi:N-methylhydantoinase B